MKTSLILALVIFSFAIPTFSYPESQMKDCLISAKNNPATKGVSEDSLKNYCDCALQAIIDQGRDIRESGYECALKNFKE